MDNSTIQQDTANATLAVDTFPTSCATSSHLLPRRPVPPQSRPQSDVVTSKPGTAEFVISKLGLFGLGCSHYGKKYNSTSHSHEHRYPSRLGFFYFSGEATEESLVSFLETKRFCLSCLDELIPNASFNYWSLANGTLDMKRGWLKDATSSSVNFLTLSQLAITRRGSTQPVVSVVPLSDMAEASEAWKWLLQDRKPFYLDELHLDKGWNIAVERNADIDSAVVRAYGTPYIAKSLETETYMLSPNVPVSSALNAGYEPKISEPLLRPKKKKKSIAPLVNSSITPPTMDSLRSTTTPKKRRDKIEEKMAKQKVKKFLSDEIPQDDILSPRATITREPKMTAVSPSNQQKNSEKQDTWTKVKRGFKFKTPKAQSSPTDLTPEKTSTMQMESAAREQTAKYILSAISVPRIPAESSLSLSLKGAESDKRIRRYGEVTNRKTLTRNWGRSEPFPFDGPYEQEPASLSTFESSPSSRLAASYSIEPSLALDQFLPKAVTKARKNKTTDKMFSKSKISSSANKKTESESLTSEKLRKTTASNKAHVHKPPSSSQSSHSSALSLRPLEKQRSTSPQSFKAKISSFRQLGDGTEHSTDRKHFTETSSTWKRLKASPTGSGPETGHRRGTEAWHSPTVNSAPGVTRSYATKVGPRKSQSLFSRESVPKAMPSTCSIQQVVKKVQDARLCVSGFHDGAFGLSSMQIMSDRPSYFEETTLLPTTYVTNDRTSNESGFSFSDSDLEEDLHQGISDGGSDLRSSAENQPDDEENQPDDEKSQPDDEKSQYYNEENQADDEENQHDDEEDPDALETQSSGSAGASVSEGEGEIQEAKTSSSDSEESDHNQTGFEGIDDEYESTSDDKISGIENEDGAVGTEAKSINFDIENNQESAQKDQSGNSDNESVGRDATSQESDESDQISVHYARSGDNDNGLSEDDDDDYNESVSGSLDSSESDRSDQSSIHDAGVDGDDNNLSEKDEDDDSESVRESVDSHESDESIQSIFHDAGSDGNDNNLSEKDEDNDSESVGESADSHESDGNDQSSVIDAGGGGSEGSDDGLSEDDEYDDNESNSGSVDSSESDGSNQASIHDAGGDGADDVSSEYDEEEDHNNESSADVGIAEESAQDSSTGEEDIHQAGDSDSDDDGR